MRKTQLSEYEVVLGLGLSRLAAIVYRDLCIQGSASAPRLAFRLSTRASRLYRVLEELEAKGFVDSIKSEFSPRYYYPSQVVVAIAKLDLYHRKLVEPLVEAQNIASISPNPLRKKTI